MGQTPIDRRNWDHWKVLRYIGMDQTQSCKGSLSAFELLPVAEQQGYGRGRWDQRIVLNVGLAEIESRIEQVVVVGTVSSMWLCVFQTSVEAAQNSKTPSTCGIFGAWPRAKSKISQMVSCQLACIAQGWPEIRPTEIRSSFPSLCHFSTSSWSTTRFCGIELKIS